MERDTKLSFGQIQREMGVTSSDKLAAMRYQTTSYMRPVENSQLETIRTMSRSEVSQALNERSLARQAEGLEKITKVWSAMHAAIAGVRGITAALKGDWDGVGEAVRALPFGIGTLSGAVMDFKAEITGARKEVERMDAIARGNNADSDWRRKTADTLARVKKEGREFASDILDEAGRQGRTGLDLSLYNVNTDSAKRVRQLQEQMRADTRGLAPGSVERKTIESDYASRIRLEEGRASNARIAAINQFATEEKNAVRTAQIEIDATRLEMQGRGTDAQLLRIRESGKMAAEEERRAGRERVAAAIETQTDLSVKLEQQKQADEARKNSLESRRSALQGRIESLNNSLSAMSGAKLPLLTAFANPNAPIMTSSQQREASLKGEMQQVRRAIEETNKILRDDKAVRVGNN